MLRKLTPRLLLVICALLWFQSAIAMNIFGSDLQSIPCENINNESQFPRAPLYNWNYVNSEHIQYRCYSIFGTLDYDNLAEFNSTRGDSYNENISFPAENFTIIQIIDVIYANRNLPLNANGRPLYQNYATDPEIGQTWGWGLQLLSVDMTMTTNESLPGTYGTMDNCDLEGDEYPYCHKIGYVVIQIRPPSYEPSYEPSPLQVRVVVPDKPGQYSIPAPAATPAPVSRSCSSISSSSTTNCGNTISYIDLSTNYTSDQLLKMGVGKPLTTLQQAVYINPINSHN